MEKLSEVRQSVIKELIWILITAIAASAFVVIVFHLYEIDLSTMVSVQRDSCGLANLTYKYISEINKGNGFAVLKDIAVPSHMDFAFLHNLGIFFCCLLFRNFGTAANFYYFSGYIMVALGMYLAVRVLKKERWIAAIAGIAYTFLPYHYMRGESHIGLACYYMVPLGTVVIVRLMDTEAVLKKSFYWFCISISILFGLTDVYYSVFYALTLLFVLIVRWCHSKNIKEFIFFACLITIPFLSFIVHNVPYFITTQKNVTQTIIVSDSQNGRTLGDLKYYGLKFIQLIIPIQHHRIPFLSDWREGLDQYLGYDETCMSTLGLVMTVGLLLSLFYVFVSQKKDRFSEQLKVYGKLNLYIILVASVGGLNFFVGMISSNIRCYNRMSVFIACLSLLSLVEFLQMWWEKCIDKKYTRIMICCLSVGIMLFSVWDQTPAFSLEDYQENWNLNHNTKQAVESIDAITKDQAKILMLPIITDNFGTKIHEMRNYEQAWNSLYSDDLQWIRGSDSDYAVWLDALSVQSMENMLMYASFSDIDGIWLDENGYAASEFSMTKHILDEQLENPLVVSESGKQYYYSLELFKEKISQEYSVEEIERWQQINDTFMNSTGYYIGVDELSFIGGIIDENNKEVELNQGDIQYGPYIALTEGDHRIDIYGENLDRAEFRLQTDCGENALEYRVIKKEPQKWVVDFQLDQAVENLEFCITNPNRDSVIVKYYHIE